MSRFYFLIGLVCMCSGAILYTKSVYNIGFSDGKTAAVVDKTLNTIEIVCP